MLAVVIPFRPFVEDGKTHRPPRERLPLPTDGDLGGRRGSCGGKF